MKASEKFFDEVVAFFDPEQITRETKFVEDLNATSMHYMYMIATIEELTKKEPSYAEMKACKTVEDACNLCAALAGE